MIFNLEIIMFAFHKIGNKVASGWYCLISSKIELDAYLGYLGQRIVKNWEFIKNSPKNKEGHCATSEAGTLKDLLILHMEEKNKSELSFVESLTFMEKVVTSAVIEIFNRNGEVYVSKTGACRPSTTLLDCESILDKIESEKLIFPIYTKNNLRIKQWTGGKHFYILENGKSIVVEGKVKWKTIKSAQDALDRYWKMSKKKFSNEIYRDKKYADQKPPE